MADIELSGEFDSAYTMNGALGPKIVEDVITFQPGEFAYQYTGTGVADEDGAIMKLVLNAGEDVVSGTWQERDPDNEVLYEGTVDFVGKSDLFLGEWSIEGSVQDNGVWVLIKKIGTKALEE